MKEIVINENNLKEEEINEEVTRVKAIIVNDKNEILLACCDNEYQFPGGHLDDGEECIPGLIREVKEETGMETNAEDYECLMTIKNYVKNYRETNKKRCNKMIYYVLKKNYDINLENACFSDYEKKGGFRLELVPLDNVEEVLIKNSSHHDFAKIIAEEMLQVLKEYKKLYTKDNFIFDEASKDDIDEIINLKLKVYEDMENKEWYEVNGTTKEFLNELLDNDGLLLKVTDVKTEIMAGFLMVKNKLKSDGNLSKIIENIETDRCIEMCNSAVLPEFRGNKLQQRLILMAENIMIKKNSNIKYSVATVHPDNIFSVNSLINLGYKKIADANLYGGKKRCIMKKDLIK